jgi:hypothetical protein
VLQIQRYYYGILEDFASIHILFSDYGLSNQPAPAPRSYLGSRVKYKGFLKADGMFFVLVEGLSAFSFGPKAPS